MTTFSLTFHVLTKYVELLTTRWRIGIRQFSAALAKFMFAGCLLYADDVILIATPVLDLQDLLDLCATVGKAYL